MIMAKLKTALLDLFYPQRFKIDAARKKTAKENLTTLNEQLDRAEAEIERIANDPNADPNVGLKARQELNKFKELFQISIKSKLYKIFLEDIKKEKSKQMI